MNQDFLIPDGGLFQSEVWKEFQKHLGKEIFETTDFWGVIQQSPVLGRYGEIPRGPVQPVLSPVILNEALTMVAKKSALSCIRLEPQHQSLVEELLQASLHVRKAPLDAQPKEILMLSLEKSESDIFAEMKSKTRYNIRLAQKKGIEVRPATNEKEVGQFLDLLAATAKRKNISFHSRKYYQEFIQFFSGEKGTTFVALHNGKVLAGSTVVVYNKTAYYIHGGSSDEGRSFMAPHLLQWEQIRFAKAKNCTQYDFGGVAIQHTEVGKDWSGITRFKTGFAPATESTVFPGTYDIIFSPTRYFLYQWLVTLKNIFL